MPRPPAPEIDHPYVFSASQIDQFELCERMWAFERIDGIKVPPKESQQLGLAVHDDLERYLEKGVPLDPYTLSGSIAMAGIKLLPLPKTPGMRVEKWFTIQFGVAAYRGLKDIEIIRPGQVPQVKDHKTTKNFIWQKKPNDLKKDTQAALYSADAMFKTGFKEVDLEWIYYRTEGARKAKKTHLRIYEPQVMETLERIDNTAQRMIHVLKTVNNGMEAKPNYGSCSAFGGCPHRTERCKISSTSTLVSLVRQKMAEKKRTSDFFAELERRKKNKGETKKDKSNKGKKGKKGILTLKKPKEKNRKKDDEPAINSSERENNPPIPDAPASVTIKGVQYDPFFDRDTWEWDWPDEVKEHKARKKKKSEEKAAKEAAKSERTAKKNGKPAKKTSKKNSIQDHEDVEAWDAAAKTDQLMPLFDKLLDAVADRVAERLSSRE